MDAVELHAADDLNVSLLWASFNRIFMEDRNSLVGMLLDIKKQMTYGCESPIRGLLPSTAPISSPLPKRGGFIRRVLNLFTPKG